MTDIMTLFTLIVSTASKPLRGRLNLHVTMMGNQVMMTVIHTVCLRYLVNMLYRARPPSSLMHFQRTFSGKRGKHWGHPKPRQGRTPGPPFPRMSPDSALSVSRVGDEVKKFGGEQIS